jgi:molybdopterin synthase catalytic subunit
MDIGNAIAAMKKEPGFPEKVGMILIHNGVVRATSRKDGAPVTELEVHPDQAKVEALRREFEARPGIFRILVEAKSGTFRPGDDLLFIVVAGDIRENVKPTLAELLDRIKSEAVKKREVLG